MYGLNASTLNAYHPIWIINPNQLSEVPVVSIRIDLNSAIEHCVWDYQRCGMHARVNYINGEHTFQHTHCVPRICSSQEAIQWLAGVQIWQGRYSSCVEVWPLKVNVHAWTHFTQCSVNAVWMQLMRIELYIEFVMSNLVTDEPVWIQIQGGQALSN